MENVFWYREQNNVFELRLNRIHKLLLSLFLSQFCHLEDEIRITLQNGVLRLRKCPRALLGIYQVEMPKFLPEAGDGCYHLMLVFRQKELTNTPVTLWEKNVNRACYVSVMLRLLALALRPPTPSPLLTAVFFIKNLLPVDNSVHVYNIF